MAIIDTALVSNGNLLIQLDDGTVVNAGRVAGPQGPAGRDGQDGSPGIPGAKGDPGTNGARWHTGVGAPEIGLGENGDLYMDVASSLLPIYQKVNGDWLFLTNLKATSSGGVGATGESAAGDGSAIIIFPSPQPGVPGPDQPSADNNGRPISEGDLWYDPTTGWIYVYYNGKWVAISDRPPVIVSPTPPDYNNASDNNTQYPLKEGDLWFDSAQAALYVAALNGDDDLVWVISTPADRSILQDEIPVGGFIFPAATQDGDTAFNDVTNLWYVYNASKKQWIDLPPGERELSYPGVLREADAAIDETYEGEADAANGDVYLNAPDHETGTRLVIRKNDRKGFAWTDLIQGLTAGDGIALVQTNYDNGLDSPQTQRVDYLIVTDIIENEDSFSIQVDYEQQNFDHLPLFGEEVSVRFLAQVSSPAVCIDFSETKPEPKCVGHIWFDSSEDEGTLYIYDGTHFIPAAPPVSLEGINTVVGDALAVQEQIIARVEDGEAAQATLQTTVADALTTQQSILDEQVVQNNQIVELEEEIESLAPSLDRGKWTLHEAMPLSAGQYAIGVAVNSGYCIDQYERCIQAAPGYPNNIDPIAQSECTRLAAECETAKENGELYIADWAHAAFLHFHKTDSDGKNHTFVDYEVGMFIDLFDQGDTGFAVFEITAAPTLDGDVYTIGVTPIQHEGEASGLARIKVFELASSDPTDFVRKTGDTMTGMLKLEPTVGSTSLTVKSNPEATNLSNIIDVHNNKGDQVFWVDSLRAGFTGKSGRPASDYHLTDKKYVDEAIHAALTKEQTAPANLEWYVYTSRSTKPSPGKAHVSGTSMLNSNIVILSLRPNNSAYAFQAGPVSGKTMHIYQGTYRPVVLTAWYFREFDGGGEWKWKGSTDVDRVKLYESYIYIATGPTNYRTANSDFSDDLRYRFTLSGFF